MKLLIRADGDASIGSGHIMRCLALAHEWNGDVAFASLKLSARLHSRIVGAGHQVVLLKDETDLRDLDVDVLVLDGYNLPLEHQDLDVPTLLIDDGAQVGTYRCTWVTDPNPDAPVEAYGKDGARVLAGPEYALVSDAFLGQRPTKCGVRDGTLLISLGSHAPPDVIHSALEAVRLLGADVHLVLGGVSVDTLDAATLVDVTVHEDVEDLASMLAKARLAILAGGSTNWEACVTGTPRVVATLADNQRNIATALSDRGCAIPVGSPPYSATVLAEAMAVWDNDEALDKMACQTWWLCDGLGARRVAAALEVA